MRKTESLDDIIVPDDDDEEEDERERKIEPRLVGVQHRSNSFSEYLIVLLRIKRITK